MFRCMNHIYCIHYADDTYIFLEAESVLEIERKGNADLVKMHSWLCKNELSLNVSKSSYMISTNKIIINLIIIKIDNTSLNSCSSSKFLGTYIDNKFNFCQDIYIQIKVK